MSNPYEDEFGGAGVSNPSGTPGTHMSGAYDHDFPGAGGVMNPSSKPYSRKTKVRQVIDPDGHIWYETYEVIKIPVSRSLAVTNGNLNMIDGGSKVAAGTKLTLTSSQQLNQIIKNLNL